MDTPAPGFSGLLGNLRGFADGLLGSAQDRLQLLAIELHEEKLRLIQVFVWISALVILTTLTLVAITFALVVLLWNTSPVGVACGLAVVYLSALIATVLSFQRFLKRQPKPFSGTLGELRADRECIRAET